MIDLRKGDCLEILQEIPDKSVELVIIDPPYEKKGNGYYCGGGAFGTTKRQYHTQLDNKQLLEGINNNILDELLRIMKKCNIYIYGVTNNN